MNLSNQRLLDLPLIPTQTALPLATRPMQPKCQLCPASTASPYQAAIPCHGRRSSTGSWHLALVGLFALGLYMHELPFSLQRLKLYNWHKWAGVSIFAAVRLAPGLAPHPPPTGTAKHAIEDRPCPPGSAWPTTARTTRCTLLFFLVPLLGWAYSSAAGFPIVWFGVLPLPDFVPAEQSPGRASSSPCMHVSAFALAGLAVLHIAAALKHQWLDRDNLVCPHAAWGKAL
jgi:cytochrome b561